MKIKLSRTDTYFPKWNGNRDLSDAEQVSVEYRYMTCEEQEKWSLIRPVYNTKDGEGEVRVDYSTHANDIWDACVLKVNGLTDDKNLAITDPKAVRKVPGIYGLVTEVVAEIKQGLTETERKNSA